MLVQLPNKLFIAQLRTVMLFDEAFFIGSYADTLVGLNSRSPQKFNSDYGTLLEVF
ncbi:MAG: hypothetical protein HC903_02220 [Methylacidiphilales bacterium]|nr:hypothetical protein [Candidatus Methylacidiphilales bacterium]